ncbi:hypothetical protein A3G06_00095 [Candidatus Nomurabacteria bacterium RIFCSPLOWO2_12_FULL_46_14]|uniref:Recombinase domain-containing protein n=1 Tax=Candidatus Nomurabacteria bacterium RIFCSPLOWO2_12_FULL_46_14 TaxID=1801797 RepID=A0A1F6YA51_9BACT|nr:MAG: hypothetical protein A3G06_00095 [Candidatus Nomurabacteria bacterium RIFCSPLOWO2_12_FULL_46_14]
MDNNDTKTPVVSLYLRGSTSQSDEDSQRYSLMERVKKLDYIVFKEYLDHNIGGDTLASDRKYAPDVIEDARLGKFHILLVTAIDRIARDEEFGLNYLRRIEETGCKVYFIDQPYANTPDAYSPDIADAIKNSRTMLLMGARMEHTRIKSRTRASKLRDIKANIWPANGHVPDGYLLDPNKKGALIINPSRAPIIQRIFDLYVDEKLTIRQIVDLLNKEGIPSVTAKNPEHKWIKDSVQDKLSNEIYIGKLPVVWKMTGEVVHIYTCLPIISDVRFAEVQEIKNEKIKRSRGNHKREYPFRPYVWCAKCGHELHTLTSSANTPNESYHYGFRKPPVAFKYKKRCPDGCGRISERNLVRGIYNHAGKFFLFATARSGDYSKPNIDRVLEFLEGGDTTDADKKREAELQQLTKELGKIREKPDRILDLYENGQIDKETFKARMTKHNSNPRIKTIEERIRFIRQSLVGEEEQKKRIDSLAIWAKEVKASLEKKRIEPWAEDMEDIKKRNSERKHTGFFIAPYDKQKEFALQLLKFIKKIHVDFPKRRLIIQTRIPKYLDGKVAFEADPVVARGRPGKDSNKNGGNGGGNNSSIQAVRANSNNQKPGNTRFLII